MENCNFEGIEDKNREGVRVYVWSNKTSGENEKTGANTKQKKVVA